MPETLVKIIETPRDGFQGLEQFIPTDKKARYINELLKAGFHGVEVGSFVSPQVIPQMKDTPELLGLLEASSSSSKIITLIPNVKGALKAVEFGIIDQLLFPFSVSPTFLKKNLGMSTKEGMQTINELNGICRDHHKELIVYLTMGFGNPYGDDWSRHMVTDMAGDLIDRGLTIVPLSDILGNASPDTVYRVFSDLTHTFPDTEFGAHLHARPGHSPPLLEASWEAGIRRYDTVLGGFGGCPMADSELVSNVNTLELLTFLESKGMEHNLNVDRLDRATRMLNVQC